MLKRKILLVLISILGIAGCSYFNPEDLNLLIEQSRGGITLSKLGLSPSAITTNAPQEITLSCSVDSDFPVSTVTADLSSVGQGEIKLNPSSDKKNWSIKFIVTPTAVGNFTFQVNAVNQKEKTVSGSIALTVTTLSASSVYVSPSGDDLNPGNQAFPFKTVGHAVTYATATGITNIYLSGGSYIEANAAYSCAVALVGLTNVRIQGGWNNGFTARSVSAYPSVIDGNQSQPTAMVIKFSTNLILDGISLKNAKADPALTNFITFRGGGLLAEQANFNFINGEISDNSSVYGGGVYATLVSGVFSNSVIGGNTAVNAFSGAVFFRSSVHVENCTVGDNLGDGVSFVYCTNFNLQDNLISSNTGSGLVISNGSSINPVYSNNFEKNGQYGILMNSSDILAIVSNKVCNNSTGMYFISNSLTPVLNNSILSNSAGVSVIYSGFYLGNNTIVGGSGGITVGWSHGMMISNNNIGWVSAYYTASVYMSGSSNIKFMNNVVQNNAVYGYYVDDFKASGGIMMIDSTNITLSGNTIVSNSYSAQNGFGGGGVGLYNSMASISNNYICFNSGRNGGGICSYSSDIAVDRNTIDQNISFGYGSGACGGGIYITYYYSTANKMIRNNSISYNVVSNNSFSTPCYGGSAIYLDAANTFIVSNRMVENATIGYFNNDSVIYIPYNASDTVVLTNLIGGSNQTGVGLRSVNWWIGKIDANIFATNRMNYLFSSYRSTITNDNTWTNINSTNYTGASALTATPNMVTNL